MSRPVLHPGLSQQPTRTGSAACPWAAAARTSWVASAGLMRRALQYAATEESYTLKPLENGKPVPGAEATEAVTGNFLLDPEVLSTTPESTVAPLVLLD